MSDQPNNLQPQPATMTATVTIIRANTGKVETHELVFTPTTELEQPKEPE